MLAAFPMSAEAIATFLVLIVSLTVHEAAHAWLAHKGGDQTAHEHGLVTINPIPHMRRQPIMMVILPLVMLWQTDGKMCLGAATTPIDAEWAWRNPRRAALVSLGGPVANFLLVILAFAVVKILMAMEVVKMSGGYVKDPMYREDTWQFALGLLLQKMMRLNLYLGLLNLLPVPPLDGAGVLEGIFPKTLRPIYRSVRNNAWIMIAMLVLIFTQAGKVIEPWFHRIVSWLE